MTFISLFSGIGGLDLGLERAGMNCIAQVEIDPYCRRVLAKHWSDVPRFEDVRTFNRESIDAQPDLICGGFPCQDISIAGNRAGIDGERSGLWSEFHRIICEFRPKFAIVENVSALLHRGIGRVLGDLANIGFDSEWHCIPAAAFGAPHYRLRVFILAYPTSQRRSEYWTEREGLLSGLNPEMLQQESEGGICFDRWKRWTPYRLHNGRVRMLPPCGIFGATDGISERMDRLKGLGNAVVPDVAEWIGRRIMEVTA